MPDRSRFEVIKPEVRAASAYTLTRFEAETKLNQNENPHEIPRELKEKVVARVLERDWGRYPSFVPTETLRLLAEFTGWHEDGLVLGNGSNELINVALIATAGPGKRVAIPQPTFALYKLMASTLGAAVEDVLLDPKDFSYDVDALVSAARLSDVLIICSPNSPTGTLLALDDMKRLVASAGGLVIIDEAYHEFSGQTYQPLLEEFSNLMLLRTFSKAKSMAGLRFGYMMTSREIATEIGKVKLPYSVNIFTLAAAETLLEHVDLIEPSVRMLIEERERLQRELARREGVESFPSHANFILIRTPHPAREVFEKLYEHGVLVRDVSTYPLLERCLRVSVGTRAENARFLSSLDRAMEELA
jgi:histidinol-phosphate aminotransferase